MYTTKRWIAVKARANDSCLKIVKDDLHKVVHCVTTSDPYGPRCKRGYLRPIGQARVKHCGNRAYTELISAKGARCSLRLPTSLLSKETLSWGREFFVQITQNFAKKTRTFGLVTRRTRRSSGRELRTRPQNLDHYRLVTSLHNFLRTASHRPHFLLVL